MRNRPIIGRKSRQQNPAQSDPVRSPESVGES